MFRLRFPNQVFHFCFLFSHSISTHFLFSVSMLSFSILSGSLRFVFQIAACVSFSVSDFFCCFLYRFSVFEFFFGLLFLFHLVFNCPLMFQFFSVFCLCLMFLFSLFLLLFYVSVFRFCMCSDFSLLFSFVFLCAF